ncbi:hypothetical protein NVP1046O_77 [Vibrio phage 1.046.O._10N.286.52.E3]|nr:hypothetical protein NVP1046O_77 [Vibrio phage 1.046.O._10N.286.52.E3]
MILYQVSSSGIVELDVKNETKCGWTQHNRGFIRRSELRKYSRYTSGRWFYTTDKDEAVKWATVLRNQMLADYNKLEFDIAHQSHVEFYDRD